MSLAELSEQGGLADPCLSPDEDELALRGLANGGQGRVQRRQLLGALDQGSAVGGVGRGQALHAAIMFRCFASCNQAPA
jgi:hypothetical protein